MPMDTTARKRDPSRNGCSARPALPACLLIAVAIVTFACGDSAGDVGPGPTQGTPFVTPAVALPSVPPDSAETAGLLVYRDTAAAQVFALNLSSGERLPLANSLRVAAASITAFDCTRDGRLIAYSNSAADGRISIVSFAGEGARSQSVEVRGSLLAMAWAPDGERIAMSVADELGYHLALLDVDSGETSTLPLGQAATPPGSSPNFLPFTPTPVGQGTPGAPRWAPDGQRLTVSIESNGRSDIYVLDVGSSNLVKVSTRPTAFTPDWSPDGRTIIFAAADDQGGLPQLYAVEADGTNERKVTASETQKSSPRWSLDGSLISYSGLVLLPAVSVRPALLHNQAVWVAGADGTNETPITDLALDAQPLAWCLRGSWLQ